MEINGICTREQQKEIAQRIEEFIDFEILDSPANFARTVGIDPSGLYKMLNGKMKITIATLKKTLEQKGITVFATIDHQAAAKAVGEELSPITLLIVGNPKVGTALMQEEPFMGIELPLKIVVYEQDKKVWVGYKPIAPIVKEYHLEKSKGIAEKIDTTMQQLIRLSIGN